MFLSQASVMSKGVWGKSPGAEKSVDLARGLRSTQNHRQQKKIHTKYKTIKEIFW